LGVLQNYFKFKLGNQNSWVFSEFSGFLVFWGSGGNLTGILDQIRVDQFLCFNGIPGFTKIVFFRDKIVEILALYGLNSSHLKEGQESMNLCSIFTRDLISRFPGNQEDS
jgi:hypothetical protein